VKGRECNDEEEVEEIGDRIEERIGERIAFDV
jgi:hypothetical protein